MTFILSLSCTIDSIDYVFKTYPYRRLASGPDLFRLRPGVGTRRFPRFSDKSFGGAAVLIACDVFDVTTPSAGAQRRFYRFLREANRLNPGLQIVIIAGNHDSAIRLEAPNPLLEELNTSIVGIVGRTDSGEIDLASLVVPLRNRAGEREAIWLAVPFLRQGDYPAAPKGESDSESPDEI